MSGVALVLAGHGSHISANTAGLVWGYVDRLRRMGVADEISACFWKEPPAFSQVLETLESTQVVIVPLFTANGYFTSQVIPTEMGLRGPTTRIGDKSRLLHTAHRRASAAGFHCRSALERHDRRARPVARPDSRRHHRAWHAPQSAKPRLLYAAKPVRIAATGLLCRSRRLLPGRPARYPQHLPNGHAPEAYHRLALLPSPKAAMSGQDPAALAGDKRRWRRQRRVRDRIVHFAEPVGTDESVCAVVSGRWRGRAGCPSKCKPTAAHGRVSPRRAQATCWRRWSGATQAAIWASLPDSRTRLAGRKRAQPGYLFAGCLAIAAAREALFIPCRRAVDTPGGWHVDLEQPDAAPAVLETVYPGVLADWSAQRRGELQTESLADIGGRQDGMFKDIQRLPNSVIQRTVDEICGACERQPTWHGADGGGLPCRAACNWWLSNARRNEKECA